MEVAMENYLDIMNNFELFNNIDRADIPGMLQCIGAYVKMFDKGDYIILDGDSIECVGAVITGMVHMVKEDVWGNKTIHAVISLSQIFGETYVFGDVNKSFVSFLAAEKAEVLFLPFRKVLHACAKSCSYHQILVDNMVALIARKNIQLTDKLEVTTKRTLRTKILTYLSQESQKSSSKYFSVPLGRIEMADYLCVDRSALTRELSKLKDEGILDYNHNVFRLF